MSSAMPPARDFSCTSEMARAVGSATCFRGMDHRWITVLLGAFCHAELGAAFPKAGALRLSQPGSRPFVGISLCLDELASRAASGYGHAGDRGRAILGFLFPIVATPLFTTQLEARIHPSTRPNAGGFDGGGRYGYELLQCADEWRDLGSTYVQKWTPGTGTYAVNPDCAAHARES
jgi:hypothetical protein